MVKRKEKRCMATRPLRSAYAGTRSVPFFVHHPLNTSL